MAIYFCKLLFNLWSLQISQENELNKNIFCTSNILGFTRHDNWVAILADNTLDPVPCSSGSCIFLSVPPYPVTGSISEIIPYL